MGTLNQIFVLTSSSSSIFQCERPVSLIKNHNNGHVQGGWPPREPRIVFWAHKLHWPHES